GVLRYQLVNGEPRIMKLRLPENVHVEVFWSGTPARTSELRGKLDSYRKRLPQLWEMDFKVLRSVAMQAATSPVERDGRGFVTSACGYGPVLAHLGTVAKVPIFPESWHPLAVPRESRDSAFLPSGAGGGDCAVWIGLHPPSLEWRARAKDLGFVPLTLARED